MMRIIGLLCLATVLPAWAQDGRRQLFNGKNLDGWAWVDNEGFRVEDGLLRTQGNKGMLWYTREKIGNAVLRVVYPNDLFCRL